MGTLYERKNINRNNTESTKSKTEKKSEKKPFEIKKKWIPLIIFVVLVISVGIFLSPIFSITEINVDVISAYSCEEIKAMFEDLQGKNGFIALLENTKLSNLDRLFQKRMSVKEESMKFEYPLIKDIVVEYDLPDKIVVKIEERVPVMITEKDGMYLLIDAEGYMLGTYTNTEEAQMPVVEGIQITNYKIGASVADGKNVAIDNSIKICSVLKQLSMLSYIDIIDVSDYNNIRMYCAPSLTIEFGGADDIGRKLSYIKGIIDSGYDGYSNGILDVSLEGNPVFRENSSSTAKPAPETENPEQIPDEPTEPTASATPTE